MGTHTNPIIYRFCKVQVPSPSLIISVFVIGVPSCFVVKNIYLIIEETYSGITEENLNGSSENENNLVFANPSVLSIKVAPSVDLPLIVILLSSLPRSGSSMMGLLLSSMDDNSVYFFEPVRTIRKSKCKVDAKCLGDHLAKFYNCKASKVKECRRSSMRVIKLVRGSLEDVGYVLSDSKHEVKVIHLTRDPRGALRSIASAGWNSNPERRCKEVNEDMEISALLSEKYPGKVMNISYERFCIDSESYTKKIYRFLYGNDHLPKRTVKFMTDHMHIQKKKKFGTYRETSSHYQEWRKEIKLKIFQRVENDLFCQLIIKKMGHNLFGTLDKL
ncbi:unnamed protein product, partial [Meganyctiphanes norvegica]